MYRVRLDYLPAINGWCKQFHTNIHYVLKDEHLRPICRISGDSGRLFMSLIIRPRGKEQM